MTNRSSMVVMMTAALTMVGCAAEDASVGSSAEALGGDVDVSLMQVNSAGTATTLWEIREPDATRADGGSDDGTVVWEILEAAAAQADGGSDDGTVIWEIVEAAAAQADGGSDDGTVVWEILEVAAGGAPVCEIADGVLFDSTTGVALLEARRNRVYAAGATAPSYIFVEDQVYQADGTLALTTDPAQERASHRRKLLIAALAGGLCGSSGLPSR